MKLGITSGIAATDCVAGPSAMGRTGIDCRFDLYMVNGVTGYKVRVPDWVTVADAAVVLRNSGDAFPDYIRRTGSWYFLVLEPCS